MLTTPTEVWEITTAMVAEGARMTRGSDAGGSDYRGVPLVTVDRKGKAGRGSETRQYHLGTV